MEKRNTGKKGNVSYIDEPFANEPIYSLNDLLYLNSRQEYIQKILNVLRNLKKAIDDNKYNSRDFLSKNNVDWNIITTIRELNILDEENNWIEEPPSIKLAINLALTHWKKSKRNTDQKE